MSRRPTRDPLMDRRSMILDVVVRAEFHVLLVVSVYLLFAGHNAPGGGFVGGLVAASACALRMAAHGPAELRRSFRLHPMTVLGAGLTVASLTALDRLLERRWPAPDPLPEGRRALHRAGRHQHGVLLRPGRLPRGRRRGAGRAPGARLPRGGPVVTVWTAAVVAVLYGAGVYMILQRTLTKVVLGLGLLVARGQPAADDRRRHAPAWRRSSAASPATTSSPTRSPRRSRSPPSSSASP